MRDFAADRRDAYCIVGKDILICSFGTGTALPVGAGACIVHSNIEKLRNSMKNV